MMFNIDDKVVYKNLVHSVVEFNVAYEDYTIKTSTGHYVYAVKEHELEIV